MSHPPYYDQHGKTFLPGYGRPLKDAISYYPEQEPFPNALIQTEVAEEDDIAHYAGRAIAGRASIAGCGYPLTLREISMQQIMDELTDKPDWQKKIFNERITNKWKKELLGSDQDVSEKMVNYIFDELKHKAKIFSETGLVTVFDQGVVKSDTIVPKKFRAALQEAVKPLEDIPDEDKDWHPGSDEKVLDLVHPSLFPLVYGLSRILPRGRMTVEEGLVRSGNGKVIPVAKEDSESPTEESGWRPYHSEPRYNQNNAYSSKFQWLPCEVDISSEKARITSYINNLHPKHHKGLYNLIEQLIDYSIPLWDKALTPIAADYGQVQQRIGYSEAEYEFGEDGGYGYDEDHRVTVRPEPRGFKPFRPHKTVCIRREYKEYGLQVIVKLANIHLTPDDPEYEGGSWHVEGQLNEHIVSTALYYYDNENITTSELDFRQQSDFEPFIYVKCEQFDEKWLNDIYGLENNGTSVQDLGGVKTIEGRLIAFPNTLQHKVQPFKLADPTKPGHRKIIALFLVDPTFKIISTANVPVQRLEWWRERMEEVKALGKLPLELKDLVVENVEFPYDMEKAKELRLELMEERKVFVAEHNETLFDVPSKFSLCEH